MAAEPIEVQTAQYKNACAYAVARSTKCAKMARSHDRDPGVAKRRKRVPLQKAQARVREGAFLNVQSVCEGNETSV